MRKFIIINFILLLVLIPSMDSKVYALKCYDMRALCFSECDGWAWSKEEFWAGSGCYQGCLNAWEICTNHVGEVISAYAVDGFQKHDNVINIYEQLCDDSSGSHKQNPL